MVYTIPSYKVERIEKKIKALNKKAVKYDVNPIGYTISSSYTIKHYGNEPGQSWNVPVVDVTLDTNTFEPITGFRFLASIEHSPSGNIMLKKSFDIEIPENFRASGSNCDHCGQVRYRKNTYIVYNVNENNYVQVGSTCIKDYLGFDVALMAARFELIDILDEDSDRDHECFYQKQVPTISLKRFLAITIQYSKTNGYISGKQAYEEGGIATGQKVFNICTDIGALEHKDIWYAEEHEEKAVKVIEFVKTLTPDNDYTHNLMTIVSNDYVTYKTANFAASMVPMYNKFCEVRIERKPSEWVGEIGTKITVPITVTNIITIDGSWGLTDIVKMITDSGDYLTWFTSRSSFDIGFKGTINATVKKHDTYKEVKNTVVKLVKEVK